MVSSHRFWFIILSISTLLLSGACGKKEQNDTPGSNLSQNSNQTSNDGSNPEPVRSLEEFKWEIDECSTWGDPSNGNQIQYCIRTLKGFEGIGRGLYAFHGMGGNEKEICSRVTSDLAPYQKEKKISHVVCPSFGPHWVIHESGRIESFSRFRAFIQSHYKVSPEQKPALYGESMGGFNVVKLSQSVDVSQIQFHKVAAACPAIFYSRIPKSILSYLPTSVFSPFDRDTSISIITSSPYFDSSKGFVYPELSIMSNRDDTVGTAKLNISGWKYDTLGGIYEGAKAFYASLPVTQAKSFKNLSGGHCEGIPLNETIEFLGK